MDTELNYKIQDDNRDDKFIQLFDMNTINKNMSMEEMLSKLSYNDGNNIIIDGKVFKILLNTSTYNLVMEHLINVTKQAIAHSSPVNIYVSLKSLTLSDLDKHRDFFLNMIKFFSDNFPNILNECFLYQTPSIFSQIYKIISIVIDKVTRNKIHIVKNKK